MQSKTLSLLQQVMVSRLSAWTLYRLKLIDKLKEVFPMFTCLTKLIFWSSLVPVKAQNIQQINYTTGMIAYKKLSVKLFLQTTKYSKVLFVVPWLSSQTKKWSNY